MKINKLKIIITIIVSVVAVSYTHLDVYKRQQQKLLKMLLKTLFANTILGQIKMETMT